MHPNKPETCGSCACRTINLAKTLKMNKPDIEIYAKCDTACPRPVHVPELPMHPSCIRVCKKDEMLREQCGVRPPRVRLQPPHGKLMYLIKAGILLGTLCFTQQQGLWGDQATATECVWRWNSYLASIVTRVPPEFDECGKVVRNEAINELVKRTYRVYKGIITTCFTGLVEMPKIAVCSYLAYKKEQAEKALEERNRIR